MKHPISAVFLARNEEKVIRRSLEAVKEWVDEIILMDMESTDATAEIGRACGALVFKTELIHNCFLARSSGIKKAKNQWILLLDADEIVSDGLAKEIIKSVHQDDAGLLLLPRANFALSGFGPFESGFPEYQPRCFKKEAMDINDYKGDVHENYEPKKGVPIKKLTADFPKSCLYHITNPTLEFFIDKINHYSTTEAKERYLTSPGLSKLRIVLSGCKAFWVHYFVRKGYRDGWRGFWLSIVFVFYKFLIFGKLWEMRLHNGKYPTSSEARDMMHASIADALKK
jgi:(heptosyl)LPS beta-1,4-glucosyltransferase